MTDAELRELRDCRWHQLRYACGFTILPHIAGAYLSLLLETVTLSNEDAMTLIRLINERLEHEDPSPVSTTRWADVVRAESPIDWRRSGSR